MIVWTYEWVVAWLHQRLKPTSLKFFLHFAIFIWKKYQNMSILALWGYGPPQVKCRLLSYSIFLWMMFQHILEMLEFKLQHFPKYAGNSFKKMLQLKKSTFDLRWALDSKSWSVDFFIRFTREKRPQNKFSCQIFSIESNYFSLVSPVKTPQNKLLSSKIPDKDIIRHF